MTAPATTSGRQRRPTRSSCLMPAPQWLAVLTVSEEFEPVGSHPESPAQAGRLQASKRACLESGDRTTRQADQVVMMPAVVTQLVPDAAVVQLHGLGQPFPHQRGKRAVDGDQTETRVDASCPAVDILRAAGAAHQSQRAPPRPPLPRDPMSGPPPAAEPSVN